MEKAKKKWSVQVKRISYAVPVIVEAEKEGQAKKQVEELISKKKLKLDFGKAETHVVEVWPA